MIYRWVQEYNLNLEEKVHSITAIGHFENKILYLKIGSFWLTSRQEETRSQLVSKTLKTPKNDNIDSNNISF